MIEKGTPNSVSDAGVAVLAIRASIRGAWLNVKINANDVKDDPYVKDLLKKGTKFCDDAEAKEKDLMNLLDQKLSGN